MQKKKRKKAQVKIQEMAFVLVAVVFLFSLLFLFFARFQNVQLIHSAYEIREQRAISMLKAVVSLPELACGSSSAEICVDKNKLETFSKMQTEYSELWKGSFITNVSVEEVYPNEASYTIYHSGKKGDVTYSTFIPLCEESAFGSACVIAKIKVTVIMPE